jgi:ATP phosphoribosyltransferase
MIFKTIQPCKTKGALEVIPAAPVDLLIDMVEQVLRNNRFEVVNAKILVVASRDDVAETTLYEDGRMLVKTLDPRLAHKSAARVYEAGTGNIEDSAFEDYLAAGRVLVKGAR